MNLNNDETTAMLSANARRSQTNKVKDMLMSGPFALKSLCFLACGACSVYNVINFFPKLFSLNISKITVVVISVVLALCGMILEVTPLLCTRRCKASIEHWVKLFSRTKGRGLLYLCLGGIQLAEEDTFNIFSYAIGFGLLGCAVLSFMVSWYASSKLNKLHTAMVRGHTDDIVYCKQMFNKYDLDTSGALDRPELVACAKELGSEFTSNELVAVFTLLDVDHNGKISFSEFENWWKGNASVDYSMV